MKHTPGPWVWMAVDSNPDALLVVTDGIGSKGICRLIKRPSGTEAQPASEHGANARLIAAAPELLEACRRMVEAIESDAKISPAMPVIVSLETNGQALALAHAAISKATGEDE